MMNFDLYAFLILGVLCVQVNSAVVHCEKPHWFACDNKRCVSALFECDGENDCGDNSDEKSCAEFKLVLPTTQCATDEYQCEDRSCIPQEKFCDVRTDCPDGSDEYEGCVKNLKCEGFRCKDGHCVVTNWVCDGRSDCPDGSDELNCGNKSTAIKDCNSQHDQYLCKNKRCISQSLTCNKKDDCGDGSDESIEGCAKAETLCTRSAKCTQICRRTPGGPVCACKPGYKLSDNHTCVDIDECESYGLCDQLCINSAGSYSCACQKDYSLQDDRKTCKADGGEALMIFSTKSEIRGLYLRSQIYYSITRNLQHVVGVSLDSNYVYWSDIEDGNEAIMRSLEDGSQREVIVTTGLDTPDDIAVDWITGNIYFSDSGYMQIGVCTNDGQHCTIVLKERMSKPRGLALLPSKGLMYWSEWGTKPCIMAGGMDGNHSRPFVTTSIEWPNGLSIDYPSDRLYWIDAKLKVIESIRLDGTDRRIVLTEVAKKPYSLAVFENKLYWSDWSSNTVQTCDKFTGKDWEILVRENNTIYGLHVYHSVLKPKVPNPCNSRPCSHLCLLSQHRDYTCACPPDMELNLDGHTCRLTKKTGHLVVGAGNTFVDYYHSLLGKPKMLASVTLKHVTALAYNSLSGGVLASDQLTDTIFHLNINTGELRSLLSVKNEILGGMDFDYIGNNLYLSDIEHKTIEVHSLLTNEKTVLYFQDQPYDIALVPEEGIMFVVFRTSDKYRIDKLRMNGIGTRSQIIKYILLGPRISLCYDRGSKRLFWSDQGTGRIESTSINGYDTYLFRTGLEPVSLAIVEDQVFWTQHGSNKLYWADKNTTRQNQKRVALHVPKDLDTLHLVSVHGTYINQNHGCRQSNGNCSHVCLVSNSRSYICACPPGMMLSVDNRTCVAQSACGEGELKCSEHDVCIKLHQRCDGVRNCPNGEDESSNCAEYNSCGVDQFKCKNGECVSAKSRCNSHYDCLDRSDEEDCDRKECQTNEFQCREGTCVEKYLVCNGQMDCPDYTDELNCGQHTCDADSFACASGRCIPRSWECDGQADCEDGSDEGEKCRERSCPPEMFRCTNGRCIDTLLKCNGIDDCQDQSDEEYCAETHHGKLVNCTKDEYKCYNTDLCLPRSVRCNGVQDCPKNDDEHGCASCQKKEFACDNQKCIPQEWVCDTNDDCGDRSDERDCDGQSSKKTKISGVEACKEFRCSNGACLPYQKVCNKWADCGDGSDEFGECGTACTKNNPCGGICYKTPTGPVCGCRSGYRLGDDARSCEDVNECEEDVCAQICRNTPGSFLCSCHEGYVLRMDKTSCKVAEQQMEIITTTKNGIRKLSHSLSSVEVIQQEEFFDIAGIDVNAKEGVVYWSNDVLGFIGKINIKTKEQKTVSGIGTPETLAVDWITDNVYFSDNSNPRNIKVCNLEQQKCAKVTTIKGRSTPMSIAIDPKHGWLFWAQVNWQYSNPIGEIYRSDTMGSNTTVIAYRNVGVVSGISIDHARSRLYWSDTYLKTIEASDLDGSKRVTFLKTDDYLPLSINIYEDSLYWLMSTTGQLQKCKLYGDRSCDTMSLSVSSIDKHFVILHASRQPFAKNYCEDNKCDYMCISRGYDYGCICANGASTDSQSTCSQEHNEKVKFSSTVARRKVGSVRQESGTMIGVIVTVVACIVVLSGYCYYQQLKSNFSKKNSLSIRFQNPSYERHEEANTPVNCISGLPPGEHEYVNPIMDVAKVRTTDDSAHS